MAWSRFFHLLHAPRNCGKSIAVARAVSRMFLRTATRRVSRNDERQTRKYYENRIYCFAYNIIIITIIYLFLFVCCYRFPPRDFITE